MKKTVKLPLFFLYRGMIQGKKEKPIPCDIITGHVFPWMTTINIYGKHISLRYLFLRISKKDGNNHV